MREQPAIMLCALLVALLPPQATGGRHGSWVTYDYAHHGQDWHMGQCGSRERQSPIDFATSAPWSCVHPQTCFKGPFYYDYSKIEVGFPMLNTGHTFAADFANQGYGGITYNNRVFNVQNVNFHAESEHTFHGDRLPLELHIVHKQYDSNHVVVVAVPFNVNAGGGPHLTNFLRVQLPQAGQTVQVPLSDTTDLLSPLVAGGQFFEYKGSLTAPPCAEQVTWLVRRDPLAATQAQVDALRDAIYNDNSDYGNWRSVMPLAGRDIFVRTAVQGSPVLYPPTYPPPPLPFGMTTTPLPFGMTTMTTTMPPPTPPPVRPGANWDSFAGKAFSDSALTNSQNANRMRGQINGIIGYPAIQPTGGMVTTAAPGAQGFAPVQDPKKLLTRVGEVLACEMQQSLWYASVASAATLPTPQPLGTMIA